MRKPWQTKEWRNKRAKFIKGKRCAWCGSKEYLTVSHPNPHYKGTYDEYISFKGAKILCRRCAFAYDRGFDLCPKCKQRYKKTQFPTCFVCSGKGIEVTCPCGRTETITRLAWEVMGSFEICHECEKVNDCEILKQALLKPLVHLNKPIIKREN